MRTLPFFALVLLAACGGEASLTGTLAEAGSASHVWLVGGPERSAVQADSFRLPDVTGQVLDLRFTDGEEEVGRMTLENVPDGARLELRGVWFEDGVAVPSAVELDEGDWVLVNGVRMGSASRLPAEIDHAATVLAVSDGAEALVVRPADPALPDLRVVVTPGTLARSPDGDPVELERLQFGDSVRIRGPVESGYLIATEVVLPREAAPREAGTGAVEDRAGESGGTASAAVARARSGGGGDNQRDRDKDRKKEQEKQRDKEREERGRGRGKGRS